VELNTTYPVKMALTRHDQITSWNRPQLPSGIVGACGKDLLLGVVSEGRYTHEVTLESLLARQMRTRRLIHLSHVWVRSVDLGDLRRLISHLESLMGLLRANSLLC